MKTHRWQPTGKTPCGYNTKAVKTNVGRYLSAGVDCKRCKAAATLVSIRGDKWNGQSYGEPEATGGESV